MILTKHPERTRLLIAVSSLFLFLSLTGFASAATTRVEATGQAGYRGVLELAASPLRTMQPTSFTLTLYDAAGQATTLPDPRCSLVMPAMPMPDNLPRVTRAGEHYAGEAVFTMAGAWQMLVTLHRNGAVIDQLAFTLDRILLK